MSQLGRIERSVELLYSLLSALRYWYGMTTTQYVAGAEPDGGSTVHSEQGHPFMLMPLERLAQVWSLSPPWPYSLLVVARCLTVTWAVQHEVVLRAVDASTVRYIAQYLP